MYSSFLQVPNILPVKMGKLAVLADCFHSISIIIWPASLSSYWNDFLPVEG